mgnify:FL=1
MISYIEQVYQVVSKVPMGKVMSYGQIAMIIGYGGPRWVGKVLHNNPYGSEKVPCHRVVKSDGSLASGYAFGGIGKQKELLENEGVVFEKEKVVRKCFV